MWGDVREARARVELQTSAWVKEKGLFFLKDSRIGNLRLKISVIL